MTKRMRRSKPRPSTINGRSGSDLWTPQHGITQSLLKRWMCCRQKAAFYLDGWSEPGGGSSALRIGNFCHDGLEFLYTERIENAITKNDAHTLLDQFTEQWVDDQLTDGVASAADLEEDVDVGSTMMGGYIDYWGDKDFDGREWVSLESEFALEWRGHILRGKRDGLFRDEDGNLWLLETKTRSRVPDRLDLNLQNLFYITATEAELNQPVEGVLYNLLKRPSIRQRQGETWIEYIDRFASDIPERPEFYYDRNELVYSADVKQEFRMDLERKLNAFVEWRQNPSHHYRNEAHCTEGYQCPFYNACASGSMAGYVQDETLFHELEEDLANGIDARA